MESLALALTGNIAHDKYYWGFFAFTGAVGMIAVAFIGVAARHQLDRIIEEDKQRDTTNEGLASDAEASFSELSVL